MEHSIPLKQLLVKEILFNGSWRFSGTTGRLYGPTPTVALCYKVVREKRKLYLNTNGAFHTLKAVTSERNTFQWAIKTLSSHTGSLLLSCKREREVISQKKSSISYS